MYNQHLIPMKKLIFLLSVFLLFIVSVQSSKAQFEGKIQYGSYDITSDGTRENVDDFTMYVTKDRILLQGSNEYEFMGSIKTEGILVRLDYEDFVFLAGDKNAMKISKNDITSMMKMFGNNGSTQKELEEADIDYETTGEEEDILGFNTEKFVFRNAEDKNRHSIVWMTREIDINWGMLAESWGSSAGAKIGNGLPTDLLFKENYFPLKMESYKNERLEGITEVTDISRSSVARGMVQVPSGVRVLSFQDYLFQKMSEN